MAYVVKQKSKNYMKLLDADLRLIFRKLEDDQLNEAEPYTDEKLQTEFREYTKAVGKIYADDLLQRAVDKGLIEIKGVVREKVKK